MEGRAPRALVLHDRRAVVDLIELTLNHGVFEVRAVATLADAKAVLESWAFDMAVVDMDHDDSPGLLKRLGASSTLTRSPTPILGLTRHGDLASRLTAFDLGVDDILSDPFSPEELLARAIVIARRASGVNYPLIPAIRMGDIVVNILNREVRAGDVVVPLTVIEQGLLYVLAGSGGRVVTRDEILNAVWGRDYMPDSNVVDRHVKDLRRKLGDDYRRPRFIATVAGTGYRFLPVYSNAGWDRPGSDTRQ